MNRLVYLSPVRWADFAQRPHKYVQWHHAHHGGKVLWLEPYPSRLPQLRDLRRLRPEPRTLGQAVPPWLELVRVAALPVEPITGSGLLNGMFWKRVLGRVAAFARQGDCELVIGKPSRLALEAARMDCFGLKVYDAMDDFPAFHSGLASAAVESIEKRLLREVDMVMASSSRLRGKFQALGLRTALVRNACDPASMLEPEAARGRRDPDRIGYVGTIASWFDWDLVLELARTHPRRRFHITGPLHAPLPASLPPNVLLEPACSHAEAMQRMATFAVGLIPFRHNTLTAAVDPVKYYEYRALGVPVLSTPFGEMGAHAEADAGVFLVERPQQAAAALDRALACRTEPIWARQFRASNGWHTRFAAALATADAGPTKALRPLDAVETLPFRGTGAARPLQRFGDHP